MVNIKGLEEVLRRKEFLFGVKIDRDEYNKEIEIVEEINNENNDEQVENKAENQNADKDKVIIIEETNEKLENIDKELVKDDKENKDKKEEEKKE